MARLMSSMHVLYIYDEIGELTFQFIVEENILDALHWIKVNFIFMSNMNIENKINKILKIYKSERIKNIWKLKVIG